MPERSNIYHKQVRLLLEVLPYINDESCFALKGGTAINMFVRDMPRLSVDIDLVYLPVEDRTNSLKHIAESLERIEKMNKVKRAKALEKLERSLANAKEKTV